MIIIRALDYPDWPEVKRIYLEGIATGQATFQTEAPDWEEWDQAHLPKLRFVLMKDEAIAAWAALSPVSSRCVYEGVAEISIYVSAQHRRQNLGYQLMAHLITESEKQNIWTIQAGIFPENMPSIKLHEKLGFRIIGYREKVGRHYGIWRNVTLLERRSRLIGIN